MHHGLKILAACVYNLIGLHILLFTTAALTYCTTKGYTSSSTSHFPATTRGLSFFPKFFIKFPSNGIHCVYDTAPESYYIRRRVGAKSADIIDWDK